MAAGLSHALRNRGVRTFLVIWFGQLISLVGTNMTGFALGVYVYQQTGSVTQFALISLFVTLPTILLSPFAGALVDRWDRRTVLIMSDTGAGLSTLVIFLLLASGRLEVWHIYLATGISSAFSAFQWPAYSASTALLVPKEHFGRASGMTQLSEAAAQIIAPAIAGAIVVTIGVQGVIFIDFVTFGFAVLTLLLVAIPRPERSAESEQVRGTLWSEARYGWDYIRIRYGLLGLLILFATLNFSMSIVGVLLTPMILSLGNAALLGTLMSVGGSGMLVGSLVMSAWGGPKRKIIGVLGFEFITAGMILLGGLRPSPVLIGVAMFAGFFCFPIIQGSSDAIWLRKVAPDVQGRVFSIRRMIAWSAQPIAFLIAGPLADYVFEPLLAQDGALADSFGRVIGVGEGRGIGLILVLLGLLGMVSVLIAYSYPRIRYVEDELPDVVQETSEVEA
jgi:MFS family permease